MKAIQILKKGTSCDISNQLISGDRVVGRRSYERQTIRRSNAGRKEVSEVM
jgi:hypothetical protein